jgi:formate dehydrogenase assembly factor FdhD
MVEAAHAFDRARNPFDLVGSMHVAAIDVDDAIAIEDCGRP